MTTIDKSFFIHSIVNAIKNEDAQLTVRPDIHWLNQKIDEYVKKFDAISPFSDQDIDLIRTLARQSIILNAPDSAIIVDDSKFKEWYERGRLGDFWERFGKYLNTKGLPNEVIKRVDLDSDKILARMFDPKSEEFFNCRGMVVGDVQAGKTLSYSALINKACDVGYKVIIVLTGVTESLRSQTQKRLDFDFVGEVSTVGNRVATSANFVGVGRIPTSSQLRVICRTDVRNDFKNPGRFSIQSTNQPILIVAKKNKSVLEEINTWINSQKDAAGKKVPDPVLVIDDEADNASVNAANAGAMPKTINHLIRKLLNSCGRVSYVGYTATPFANIFINPDNTYDASDIEDLFPRDFVVALMPPDNYCGGKFFFLDADTKSYVLKTITDATTAFPVKKPVQGIPESLKKSIRQFFIASAIKDIRRARGFIPDVGDNRFDSCLVNISVRKTSQNTIKPIIEDYVDVLFDGIHSGSNSVHINNLKEDFEADVRPYLESDLTFDTVLTSLLKMVKPVVVAINTDSEDQLTWEDSSPRKVIAVGGFTLSRGITLCGLTISYIYRSSKMFDTIMQMGRWFGYRDGYRDLVRLWCEPNFENSIQNATRASEDLKGDIIQMTKLKMTPRQFGMKVSTYPGLLPTSKNKMKNSSEIEIDVSFEGTKPETHCFFSDRSVEDENYASVLNLAQVLKNEYSFVDRLDDKNRPQITFENVDSRIILNFMQDFKVHTNNKGRIAEGFFMQYLDALAESDLKKWDVIFYSRESASEGKEEKLSAILGRNINLQPRSVFTQQWREVDHDNSCVHLSNNRTVTAAGAANLVKSEEKPTLLINCLTAKWLDKKENVALSDIPDHLRGVLGKTFVGIKVYFPKVSRNFKPVTVVATLDYIRKLKEENLDDSEDLGE